MTLVFQVSLVLFCIVQTITTRHLIVGLICKIKISHKYLIVQISSFLENGVKKMKNIGGKNISVKKYSSMIIYDVYICHNKRFFVLFHRL